MIKPEKSDRIFKNTPVEEEVFVFGYTGKIW